MKRLNGKRAVITGGASGLGAETVRRFVAAGAQVVIVDADEGAATALRSEIGESHTIFVRADISRLDEVEAMMTKAVAWLGAVDILFNNAGIGGFDRVTTLDPSVWDRVLAVDLTAMFYCCRAALPHMPRPGGVIVNNASISGMGGDFANSAYNAAKGGVINFTRGLAVEYGPEGVRANVICPGLIETPATVSLFRSAAVQQGWLPRIPLGRQGQPGEVADLVVFLASNESTYISGAVIPIDGGMTASTGQPDIPAILASLAT